MSAAVSLDRFLAKQLFKKTVSYGLSHSLVSFSFDDFPTTALTAGAPILEKHNCKGTFYASLGQAGKESPGGIIANTADMHNCAARGHELACHTFDHVNCTTHNASEIAATIERNLAGLSTLAPHAIQSFAYPYGETGINGKKIALQHYQTARTTYPGINTGNIDLGMLRAVPLYSRKGTQWQTYFQQLERTPGWLIFYTHDVSPTPSPYGCTPETLEMVITQALNRNHGVTTIHAAANQLMSQL